MACNQAFTFRKGSNDTSIPCSIKTRQSRPRSHRGPPRRWNLQGPPRFHGAENGNGPQDTRRFQLHEMKTAVIRPCHSQFSIRIGLSILHHTSSGGQGVKLRNAVRAVSQSFQLQRGRMFLGPCRHGHPQRPQDQNEAQTATPLHLNPPLRRGPLHRERNATHRRRGVRCPAPHCSKSAHAPDP